MYIVIADYGYNAVQEDATMAASQQWSFNK